MDSYGEYRTTPVNGRWRVERWEPGRRTWIWVADFDTRVEAHWYELNLGPYAVAGRHRRAMARARQRA